MQQLSSGGAISWAWGNRAPTLGPIGCPEMVTSRRRSVCGVHGSSWRTAETQGWLSGLATRGLLNIVKGRIDIAGAVEHAYDINAIVHRCVEDDIPPKREAP